jgi:predicted  nucleic acid-binding Zn-ribbon protein
MHPDLPKLLEVQVKDRRLAELDARAAVITAERAQLDAALQQGRDAVASADRAAADAARRRAEAETKLEAQRVQHERRRARLDQERNPRVAAQLLADVELGRNILAQEESEWVRMADDVATRDTAVRAANDRLTAALAEQSDARAALDARMADIDSDLAVARAERDASASHLDRTLRIRYDRLRKSRKTEVLVPAQNTTCTACYTAIPRSRIGQLQADGILIDGCEMCGAIIYLAEAVA